MGFPGKNSASKNFACNAGDPGSIPGSGRSPAGGIGCPLQYSWLPWWLRWWRIRLQCGRPGFCPWVGKTPWRRAWQPTPVVILCIMSLPHTVAVQSLSRVRLFATLWTAARQAPLCSAVPWSLLRFLSNESCPFHIAMTGGPYLLTPCL